MSHPAVVAAVADGAFRPCSAQDDTAEHQRHDAFFLHLTTSTMCSIKGKKVKVKLGIALLTRPCRNQPRCTIAGSGSWLARANGARAQWCSYNTHNRSNQLHQAFTPVSIHQMAPSVRGRKHPITAYYSVYRPRKDERLSRPGWLVTYRNKVPPPGVEPGHGHPSQY